MLSFAISSTDDRPLPIEEDSYNFITILLIITGRPQEATSRPENWPQAKQLYLMMQKYQLDIHQTWFSEMCSKFVDDSPLDALFLACNQPYIDTTLAKAAICDGMANSSPAQLFNAVYFVHEITHFSGYSMELASNPFKLDLLHPRNTTFQFGIHLGFKGLLAYNATFQHVSSKTQTTTSTWYDLAAKFVVNARKVEREIQDTASTHVRLTCYSD